MLKLILLLAVFAVALGAPSGPTNKSLGIIGGTPADISQFPWTVSVQYLGEHVCGGSLISDTWVLTSGRCIDIYKANLSIRAGSSQSESGGVAVEGDKYVIHPDYNLSTLDNDFGLISLVAPVNHANASAIQLPAENQAVQAGAQLTLTGWGSTSETGFISDNLLQTTVPVVSAQQCSQAYAGIRTITNTMLCAGLLGQGGKGPCQGDTGGPGIVNNQLVGVVSWGSGCARPNYPAVFANVAVSRSWIRETTGV